MVRARWPARVAGLLLGCFGSWLAPACATQDPPGVRAAGAEVGPEAGIDALRSALSFAATFDRGLDAEHARGDARLCWAPTWNRPRTGTPGLPPSGAIARPGSGGVRGGALEFRRVTDELLFFHGERNFPWRRKDWSGTISFWLRADPVAGIREGFCDPLTVTPREWNDAALFVEFERRPAFRDFRLAAYADHSVWNPQNKPWESLAPEEKSLAGVPADAFAGDRWTHVVAAFERFNTGAPDGVARLYVDGKLAAELSPRTQTWTWEPADARILLGLGYTGFFDELALFDRALTAEEIGRLHALGGGLAELLPRPFELPIGTAKVDVTPTHPIRLCGYAARETEAESSAQRLFARALAVGEGADLAVLMSVDNCAVPAAVVEEVAARLAAECGLKRERFTVCATHTHTGPCLVGAIDLMFGRPIPADQIARIEQYTRWFVDRVEEAALAAVAARAPATLKWAEGQASFARNRRTAGGPVDPALPILAAFAPDGSVRAVVQNYACHCTTCGPGINQHCGDWAGYASEYVEAAHAGAVALTVIGCGADANPAPGVTNQLRDAMDHGRAIATEVERLLGGPMRPIAAPPACGLKRLEIPYGTLPTRAQWEERAKRTDAVGNHARHWLGRLDRGEALPAALPYFVQAWTWGDDLAQVFLAGEVVVDYALRIKRELDRARVWVSGYTNDVACYIPSRRILAEGGYEAEGAMTYYGRPGRLAPAVEELILDAVHDLVPDTFASDEQERRFPSPKSPEESAQCFRLAHDDLAIELVAAEPLIESPVAIDFAADGSLLVCEMNDYPTGMGGRFEPGGRVKRLRDTDGDGAFDRAEVLVRELPFPTGVMAWRGGALVCAAPDILYVEDTDGDGRADVRQVLFTGFSTENYQARVNSLTWGLDGWIHGAAGLFGGVITPQLDSGPGVPVDCRGRDFRIDPDRRVIEPVEGLSQQGRVRDDFDRWFGCDSGCLVFQFPLPDRYVKRNPFVASPDPRWNVLDPEEGRRLFQVSAPLERFNDPGDQSRVTSACGVGIYRDELLGEEFAGNAFTCESVANVVRRTVLTRAPDEVVLRGVRGMLELDREFLASTDPWFRPVQATTGPDGALWIVNMYRFVIEHPRWIPASKLAELDVRAGADKGRIWRIVPKGRALRPVPDLTRLWSRDLVTAIASPNGPVRDLAHQQLLRAPPTGPEALVAVVQEAFTGAVPGARLQALHAAAQLHLLEPRLLRNWFANEHDGRVLAAATVLAEPLLRDDPTAVALLPLVLGDASREIVFHVAASLGEWSGAAAGVALGEILVRHLADPWIRASVLTGAPKHAAALLAAVLTTPESAEGRAAAIEGIVATAGGLPAERQEEKLHVLDALVGADAAAAKEPWRWRALGKLIGAMERQGETLSLAPVPDEGLRRCLRAAWQAIEAQQLEPAVACAALELLFPVPKPDGEETPALAVQLRSVARLLQPAFTPEVNLAALGALAKSGQRGATALILAALPTATPRLRGAILDVLFQRRPWLEALVAAAEEGNVPKACFDAAHRDRLLRHDDAALRERAEKLFARSGTQKRAQILEQFRPALDLAGDPVHGAELFTKLCASCHRFRGEGFDVGPDLAALADRSAAALLTSTLDPNAAVNAEFVAYNVELTNGDQLTGLVRAETSGGFALVMANNLSRALLRMEVKEVVPSRLSLMPESLDDGLAPQDLADLIAWLQSAPAPLGSETPEQAAAARRKLRADGMNGFERIVDSFDTFRQPSWLGPTLMHYCRQTDGRAQVTWRTQAVPADLGGADPFAFSFPAAVGFRSQPQGKFTLQLDGRPLLEFDVATDDAKWSSADGKSTLAYRCHAANTEDSTGEMTLTVPAEWLTPGKPVELNVIGSAANSQRWFGVLCPTE